MNTIKRSDSTTGGWSRNRLVLLGFLAIAGYFLWTEHRAHVVQYLPYALLLLCPLLHMFHGGHGSHSDGHSDGGERK
ncbi:MAG TPA: DUF2933 domain-containing protein [Candidatus Binatia bacterium]|nr:DUF2933 domain-containing protein [Candidatus Binatia bacterium]